MKKKAIENIKPVPCRKKQGWWIQVQMIEEILVLNIYKDRILQARHCINIQTNEYATLKNSVWEMQNIERALGLESSGYYRYYDAKADERFRMSAEDVKTIRENITLTTYYYTPKDTYELICEAETDYGRVKRESAEERRICRVNDLMRKIPVVPLGLKEWINKRELGGMDFCLKDRETKQWSCSSCGREFEEQHLKKANGTGKPRNNDMVVCPHCEEEIKFLSRKQKVEVKTHFCMAQPIDDAVSVVRHFTAVIYCAPGKRKQIGLEENIRIVLFKNPVKKVCDIFYEQSISGWVEEGIHNFATFDNKSNPYNRKEYIGYMYDDGIEEAFKDTVYEDWTRLFIQMAAAGVKVNYNRMMVGYATKNYIQLIEMLFRGRFYKLLTEESEKISYWDSGYYWGDLQLNGSSIEDVFDIRDRQKINRIRENNGGIAFVNWMRWSDQNNQKISDKALKWLIANKIAVNSMKSLYGNFSIEQAMNYIERQRKESYEGKSVKAVISQYEDYIRMCERLKKDITDEMIYRPRELKRRHDEAVQELERRRAELKAEEYSVKFGEAENVLKEIKDKYEYAGEKFFIKVPERIVDIVTEGNYLHHCAGATDRYFDRIKQHETYICFLRTNEEPDTPFYTIEVEPGGTIRQHRGMYDEEPNLEEVKPFLREWQKEIRKRMNKKDHERAAISKVKREENIAELREKNNIRVLNGLMEDFMEAIG